MTDEQHGNASASADSSYVHIPEHVMSNLSRISRHSTEESDLDSVADWSNIASPRSTHTARTNSTTGHEDASSTTAAAATAADAAAAVAADGGASEKKPACCGRTVFVSTSLVADSGIFELPVDASRVYREPRGFALAVRFLLD